MCACVGVVRALRVVVVGGVGGVMQLTEER